MSEKKFIAFANNGNFKMGTHEEALAWATRMLQSTAQTTIHLAEVVEMVERQSPPIIIRKFVPEALVPSTPKEAIDDLSPAGHRGYVQDAETLRKIA